MLNKFNILYLILIVAFIISCNNNEPNYVKEKPDVASKIARYYGASSFKDVNSIEFTFNVQKNDKQIHRSWYWEPKNDLVKFFPGNNEVPVTYYRKQLSNSTNEQLKKIDSRFINDQYWLLFPLHLVLDKNVTVTLDSVKHNLPIGEGTARLATVEYAGGKGYTPNDKYELFIDDNYKILQWIYRRNNSPTPTRLTKWEDYKKFGPLTLSLNRPGIDSTFRVWFTNVKVK